MNKKITSRTAPAAQRLENALPKWKLSYRTDEAAAATGYGESTLCRKIAEGRLKAKKDGNVTVILREDLAPFLNDLPYIKPRKQMPDGRK